MKESTLGISSGIKTKGLQESSLWNVFRHSIFPLFLLISCPITIFVLWDMNTHFLGHLSWWYSSFLEQGWKYSFQLYGLIPRPEGYDWGGVLGFILLQILLYHFLPGKKYFGPETQKGLKPIYRENGFFAFLITFLLYNLLTYGLGVIPASYLYEHFPKYLVVLNIFSLIFCFLLYWKGKYFPSSKDCGTSGNFIFDYYWGTELYPSFFSIPVKMITNCRFGLMVWPLLLLSFMSKQIELNGIHNGIVVSVVLQILYVAKFFIWEKGYMRSTDIIHDRAGFYICWGCLVWVPAFYTSATYYMVQHPVDLSFLQCLSIFVLGCASILCNYLADRQRMVIRENPGLSSIWGKKPRLIHASYQSDEGGSRQTVLLASGYWGLARHFHFLPELLAAFSWSISALFEDITPYFYLIFLTLLLLHRMERDDARCAKKYGKYWTEYQALVPYKIIPYIY